MTTVPEVPGRWRKSSRSSQETDCVELDPAGAVRDSKNPDGPVIRIRLSTVIAAAKAGQLDS